MVSTRADSRAGGGGGVHAADRSFPSLAFPELPIGPGQAGPPHPCSSRNFPCAAPGLLRDEEMESHRRPQRARANLVPKACPQARPWGVEYCRQPARSSRAGQGAPPFWGSCCTRRLRTRAVGLHWSAQPLQGLQDPTMQGRAEKQQDGAQREAAGQALPPPRPAPVRRKAGQGRGHWLRCPAAGLMAGHLPQGQEGGSEPGTHPAETQRPAGDPLILLPAWVRALLWVPLDFSCSLPWREPFLLEQ